MVAMTRTLVQIDAQVYDEIERLANELGLRPAQLLRMAVRGLLRGWIPEETLPRTRVGGARRQIILRLPPEDRQALIQFCAERGLYLEGVVERLAAGLARGHYTIRIPVQHSLPDREADGLEEEEAPCPEPDSEGSRSSL